jgi:hypothetical protein
VRLLPLVLIVVVGATAASCAKAQARTEPVMPVLAPPPPPPRVVETYIDEPVPTIEPSPGDSALLTPPSRPPMKPPAPRQEPAKPEPVRIIEPERPPSSTAALTLKPAPGGEGKTEASIRALIGRASRDLQRVNYAALDADGRAQFDTARRFMQQAEDALKAASLAFAGKLADKAATMAAVLVR